MTKTLTCFDFKFGFFSRSLLMMAKSSPMIASKVNHPERGTAYDFDFECPRCNHQNEYRNTIIPLDAEHTIRVTCRSCFNRWDIPNSNYSIPKGQWEKIDRFGLLQSLLLPIGEVMLKTRRYSMFHRIFNRAQNKFGSNPKFRYLMAKFYKLTGNKDEMVRSVISGAGMEPLNPAAHLKLSEVFIEIDALGAAKLHLDQAKQLGISKEKFNAESAKIIELQGSTQDKDLKYFVSWSDAEPPKRVNWLKDAMELPVSEVAE